MKAKQSTSSTPTPPVSEATVRDALKSTVFALETVIHLSGGRLPAEGIDELINFARYGREVLDKEDTVIEPAFFPVVFPKVGVYNIARSPRSRELVELYAKDKTGVAEFVVTKDVKHEDGTVTVKRLGTVELYYRTDRAPLPYGYGVNGEGGGELSWESGYDPVHEPGVKKRGATILRDWDGDYCLDKRVGAVLRALGFTVGDVNFSTPLDPANPVDTK